MDPAQELQWKYIYLDTDDLESFEWISVAGHSNEFYNGNYWSDGELWNGRLHLMSDNGA